MEDPGELSRAKQTRVEQSRVDGRPRRAGQLVTYAKGSQVLYIVQVIEDPGELVNW